MKVENHFYGNGARKLFSLEMFSGYCLTVFLVLALASGLSVSAKVKSGKAPAWATGKASSKYPSEQYLIGIGRAKKTGDEAEDIKSAENAARAEVASQIRVQVQSTLTTRVQEQQTYIKDMRGSSSRTTGAQDVVSEIMARVDLELEGIQIADIYYDKKEKQYCVLAVLERKPAASNLRKYILRARDAAEGYYREGMAALNQRDVARAVLNFKRARQELMNIESKEAMLTIISGRPGSLPADAITIWKCQAAMDQALESIRFVVQIFEENPLVPASALVQSQVIQSLRQKGYNVMDNATAFSGTEYNTLRQASPAQLRQLPGLTGNYLVLGKAVARESSRMTLGKTSVYFYLTSAELKIVNLDTGKILVNEAFDWGDETKSGKPSREKAASDSLTRAGALLAERVSRSIEDIFKSLE